MPAREGKEMVAFLGRRAELRPQPRDVRFLEAVNARHDVDASGPGLKNPCAGRPNPQTRKRRRLSTPPSLLP